MFNKKKKVGLSFSGGGAKALVYLGVIKALEELEIDIQVMGGLSGGALVSGLYSLGYPIEEIIEQYKHINFTHLWHTNPIQNTAVFDSKKVHNYLKEITNNALIEDCKIPLLVFATDLKTQEVVIFKKGELAAALTGSSVYPPILRPFHHDNHELVDGGYSVKFGAQHFREAGANVVIGVNLDNWLNADSFPGPIRDLILSVRCIIGNMEKMERKLDPIDLEISGFDADIGMFDFKKENAEKLVNSGYERTMEFKQEILKLVQ